MEATILYYSKVAKPYKLKEVIVVLIVYAPTLGRVINLIILVVLSSIY